MGKFVFKIKIQSFSDIITNSSSETFVIKSNDIPAKILQKELERVNKSFKRWYDVYDDYQTFSNLPREEQDKYESCSGDGGTIEVQDWESSYLEWKEDMPESKKDRLTPEIWALNYNEELDELKKQLTVTIDQGFKNTIQYFIENYEVYEENCWNFVTAEKDPVTGRLLKVLSYGDWKKLPEERRAFNHRY